VKDFLIPALFLLCASMMLAIVDESGQALHGLSAQHMLHPAGVGFGDLGIQAKDGA
jgi:hypothetical protein